MSKKYKVLFLAMLFSLSTINGMEKKEEQYLIKIPFDLKFEKDNSKPLNFSTREDSGLIVKDKSLYLNVNKKAPFSFGAESWKEQIQQITSHGLPWVLALTKKINKEYCCYGGVGINTFWYWDISKTKLGYCYDNSENQNLTDPFDRRRLTNVTYFTVDSLKQKVLEEFCVNADLKKGADNCLFYTACFYWLKLSSDFIENYNKRLLRKAINNELKEFSAIKYYGTADSLQNFIMLLSGLSKNKLVKGSLGLELFQEKKEFFQLKANKYLKGVKKYYFKENRLLDKPEILAWFYTKLGCMYYRQNKFDKAEVYLLETINAPENLEIKGEAYECLSELYKKQERFDESGAYRFKKIEYLKDNAEKVDAYENLALWYKQREKYNQVAACYLSIIQLWPLKYGLHEAIYDNLATLYHGQNQFDEAEHYYFKSIMLSQDGKGEESQSKKYYYLGLLYQDHERFAEAEKCFVQSIELSNDLKEKASMYLDLTELYEILERFAEAADCRKKAEELQEKE